MINVVGLGYIGLPTSLILASNNNEVIGTDINEEVIEGAMRFRIEDDSKGIRLYPISIYCIEVENGYSFY